MKKIVSCIRTFFESSNHNTEHLPEIGTKMLQTPLGTAAPNFVSFDESTLKAGGLDATSTGSLSPHRRPISKPTSALGGKECLSGGHAEVPPPIDSSLTPERLSELVRSEV